MDLFTELPARKLDPATTCRLCGYYVSVWFRPLSHNANVSEYYWVDVTREGKGVTGFALVPDDYLRGMAELQAMILLDAGLTHEFRPTNTKTPWSPTTEP